MADQSNDRIVAWKKGTTVGQVVAGENGRSNRNDKFSHPLNVIVDKKNDSLIIADSGNKRIVRWPLQNGSSGETIISNIDCQGLAMDKDGYLYITDIKKHEVRRYRIGESNGTLVAGGNGNGDRFNQLNNPYFIFVNEDYSVYVSECDNHRVTK